MLYFSDETRVSHFNAIEQLIKKLACSNIDYESGRAITNYLDKLKGVIKDEINATPVESDALTIDVESQNKALDLYWHNEKRIKKHIRRGMDATQYIDEGRGMELILDALGIDYSPIEDDVWGE